MTLDPTLATALAGVALAVLGALATMVKAWGENIVAELKAKQQQTLNELKANTQATAQAKEAAEKAAEQADLRQRLTAAQLELDDLRRRWAYIEASTACEKCRELIRGSIQLADRRKHYDAPPKNRSAP